MKINKCKHRTLLRSRYLRLLTGVALFSMVSLVHADIPTPKDFLGFEPGTARKLADAYEIIEYFQILGKGSDRVLFQEVGKATEGTPFIAAIITSEANHQNLETLREYQQLLSDPRLIDDQRAEEIIASGKTIIMINCTIHATEIGAAQMSMRLAYDLATSDDPTIQRILDNVILLLVPMHNPDGVQMVVDWYEKYVGTEYEGGRMPWLYQKYVGHDNNRDWYMFTQVESRLTLKVHNAWHPQIVVDMHQMGSRGARLFVPPYVDPYEPNVDPILRQQVAVMGTFMASELTGQGKGGVMHSLRFDAWTPARAYHHYHGGIRILTEAASVKIATPVTISPDDLYEGMLEPSVKMPLPWKGGEWTLQDIVDYDYAAAMAALTNAAGLRASWLRNFYNIQKKAVGRTDAPYAYIVPEDQSDFTTAVKMLQILDLADVEIHRAEETFTADGQPYPAGTYIVYIAQPFGGFAKSMLERQVYPEIRETPGGPLKTPYDVVGHTLPLLMGVDAVQIDQPFDVEAELLEEVNLPVGSVTTHANPYGFLWGHSSNDDIVALNRLLTKDYTIYWAAESFEKGDCVYAPGTMIVESEEGLETDLRAVADELWVHFKAVESKPLVEAFALKQTRLGLYKSWTASMDEGWTRWVLEQYEFPYSSIYDKDIREGRLNEKLDVLIIPDFRNPRSIIQGMSDKAVPPEYAGGIGDAGVENIRAFVEGGGTLITFNSSARYAIETFDLPVHNDVGTLKRDLFFIPGSLLQTNVDNHHPIGYGYGDEASIFFRRSPVFTAQAGRTVVRYPMENPLLSGWLNGDNYMYNKSAIVDVPQGDGKVILIGFPVQYRAQSYGTFRFLFNAIHYGPARLTRLSD